MKASELKIAKVDDMLVSMVYRLNNIREYLIELEKRVDALEPKTGYWIDDEFGSKCSCCGMYTHLNKFNSPMKFKHCSMCGAKMESEETETWNGIHAQITAPKGTFNMILNEADKESGDAK